MIADLLQPGILDPQRAIVIFGQSTGERVPPKFISHFLFPSAGEREGLAIRRCTRTGFLVATVLTLISLPALYVSWYRIAAKDVPDTQSAQAGVTQELDHLAPG